MMKRFFIILSILLLSGFMPTPVFAQRTQPLIVDHDDIWLFDHIPDQYIQAASQLTFMFRHASVGTNVSNGLSCLGWNDASGNVPNYCLPTGMTREQFYHDIKYDRSNWSFQWRGNPFWTDKVTEYMEQATLQANNFQYFGFKFGNVDINFSGSGRMLSNPNDFFLWYETYLDGDVANIGLIGSAADQQRQQTITQNYKAAILDNPQKNPIYWTMTLSRAVTQDAEIGNDRIRQFVNERNGILFDFADIESHHANGTECRDGSTSTTSWVPGPYLALCDEYTNETYGGHLNGTGTDRVARAWWVLMAQLAGWNPNVPPPTPGPSATPVPSPSQCPRIAGDVNYDCFIDDVDMDYLFSIYARINPPGDYDQFPDQKVNAMDMGQVIKNWTGN